MDRIRGAIRVQKAGYYSLFEGLISQEIYRASQPQ